MKARSQKRDEVEPRLEDEAWGETSSEIPPALERTTTETEVVSELFLRPSASFSEFENTTDQPGRAGSGKHRFIPGSVLGSRYRIIDLIGRGGMGEVYRAEDLKLGQAVALKFLPEGMAQNVQRQARFLDEVKISRQVSHPNVCRVYDLGEVDGQPFITMEFIDGEDLASLLRQIGRFPQSKAVEIGCQICHGLAAAHQRGFLHRDLKPSNLMVDRQGIARITDFGLAALADQIVGAEIRQGTPSYMSPEQLSGEDVSTQSDLYALGLVFYKLFTGQSAFVANSRAELVRMHRDTPPRSPRSLVPDLHPAIEKVILWCLEKDPQDRPQSAGVVASALSNYQTHSGDTILKTLLQCEFGDRALNKEIRPRLNALLERYEGRRLIQNDDSLLFFDRPVLATQLALALSRQLHDEEPESDWRLVIHLAEVHVAEDDSNVAHPNTISYFELGLHHQETLASLIRLAQSKQILLTRGAFDLARQSALDGFGVVRWLAHGSYEVEGMPDAIEIFEVGFEDRAPLTAPLESQSVRRQLTQGTISGWRPAPQLELPERPHWVIQKKLGQGGFGEVWLAEHQKTKERRVFKFCYDSASLRSLQREITLFRLLKETLGHRQDITRILDWNFDEPPYFIEAEYTEGGSLVEWVESQGGLENVPLANRLELVAQVATALAAAHSVGVLHKDVKPANVLIISDDKGGSRAQLSDFGVGLVTEKRHLIDAGITVLGWTEHLEESLGSASAGAGTPLYRAPELLEGKPPSLQADIYALGVMLYQIVAGDFSRALAPGWEDDIHDPLRIEDISPAVVGVPEKRLSNALQLAESLRSLPRRKQKRIAEERDRNEARRAKEALERARKRRQVTAVLIFILAVFAATMFLQSRRAEREAEAARQVSSFLEDLYKGLDPDQILAHSAYTGGAGDQVTIPQLLRHGAARVETELSDQPWIQAKLYQTIGVVLSSHGAYQDASQILKRAVELRQRLHEGREHLEVAESLTALADSVHELERLQEAEDLARQGLALRRSILGEEHLDVAESLELLAHILNHNAQFEAAETFARDALAVRRELLGEVHSDVAKILDVLAYLLHRQGKNDEAEPYFYQSLDIREQLFGNEHTQTAISLDNLGYLRLQEGNLQEAESYYRQTLELRRSLLGEAHPLLVASLRRLASTVQQLGSTEEAKDLLEEAIEMQQSISGKGHKSTARPMVELAMLQLQLGEAEEAEGLLQKAFEVHHRGEDHFYTAFIIDNLTRLRQRQGRFQEAQRFAQDALEMRKRMYPPGSTRIAYSMETLAQISQQLGQFEEAEKLFRDALEMRKQLAGQGQHERSVALSQRQFAQVLRAQDRFEEAEALLVETLDAYTSSNREVRDLFFADLLNDLARLQLDLGLPGKALDYNEQSVTVLRTLVPEDSWQSHRVYGTRGACLTRLGRYKEAEPLLLESYEVLKDQRGEDHFTTLETLQDLVVLYEAWGKKAEAERFERVLREAEQRRLTIASPPRDQ